MKLCCCCRCWSSDSDDIDDASTLVVKSKHDRINREDSFYVPRRHSSYNAGTFNAIQIQPQMYLSYSFSSSEDDEIVPATTHSSRYWSSASVSTEMTSYPRGMGLRTEDATPPVSPGISSMSSQEERYSVAFDRRVLTEILEADHTSRDENVAECSSYRWENEHLGSLAFTTDYSYQEEKLKIYVRSASKLPLKGSFPHYGTFVKVLITSTPRNFKVCRPVRKTLNPVYDEECTINLSRSKWKAVQTEFLRLSVFDYDRQGKYDAIGHALVPMNKITGVGIQTFSLPITPMTLPIFNIGEILLSLTYVSTQSILSFNVIRACNLRLDEKATHFNLRPLNRDTYDTYAKVTLVCAGKKVKSSRSQIFPNCKDPIYRHKSNFVIPAQFTLESSVIVTIAVKGIFGSSVTLGRVIVGPYTAAFNKSVTHWGVMLQDCKPVIKWRNLCL